MNLVALSGSFWVRAGRLSSTSTGNRVGRVRDPLVSQSLPNGVTTFLHRRIFLCSSMFPNMTMFTFFASPIPPKGPKGSQKGPHLRIVLKSWASGWGSVILIRGAGGPIMDYLKAAIIDLGDTLCLHICASLKMPEISLPTT